MATTVARLQAVLSADTRDFDRAMGRSQGKFKTFGKAAALGLGAAGVGAAFAVLRTGFREMQEQQAVMAQTEAVLKSTGGTAKVSAGQIEALASALSRKSGVDDEAIQSGQNMLLTFTKIRNETGKGNQIFNEATKATLDLSVAMGKDMQSSALLVGKALNDPVKGMSALTRAGIQFTDAQKDTVKALVATGDTMGAQKIILGELETQFGGSAKAFGDTIPGQMAKARQAFEETSGKIMQKLLPAITKILEGILRFVTWLDNNPPGKILNDFITGIKTKFDDIKTAIKNRMNDVVEFIGAIPGRMWRSFAEFWATNFLEPLKEKFAGARETVKTWGENVGKWIKESAVAGILGIGNAVWDVVNNIWEKYQEMGATIRGWGKSLATWIKNGILGGLEGLGKDIWEKIKEAIEWVKDRLTSLPSIEIPRPKMPSIPGWVPIVGDDGDAHDPNYAGINLMGASPVMAPFAYAASQFGLQTTSGLRPGAITANGTPSDHGIGKALDVAGSANAMAAFFMSLLGNRAVKQAFYDPRGSIFGGAWSSYREGGHSDHVHVATYDKGGWLKPGLTLAYNGTGAPERVGGGNATFHINLGGEHVATVVWDQLRNKAQVFERRNGRSAF
jgi:hypothetical protein